jgi:hypothetical protein
MANKFYPKYKENLLKADANYALNSAEGVTGVYCCLIDTGVYTYSDAHQFYSSLSGIVGTDQEILSKTQALGVFDGNDVTFPAVTGASCEALVFYRKNAGANTTWPLIEYEDTGVGGLPVTPNSGSIAIAWNASGIFTL